MRHRKPGLRRTLIAQAKRQPSRAEQIRETRALGFTGIEWDRDRLR